MSVELVSHQLKEAGAGVKAASLELWHEGCGGKTHQFARAWRSIGERIKK